jgi:transmembrane sensor
VNEYTHKERRLKAAEHAAHWLVALQSEELSSQERADFIDWLRESPLHVSEMLHACRLHRDLSAFSKWDRVAPFSDDQLSRVIRLLPRQQHTRTPIPRIRTWVRRSASLAACVVGLAILSVIVVAQLGQTVWKTQWGERREVTLSDGSIMDLAPYSEVRVRYEVNARMIALDHGEALFHVAKNADRPFIVQAAHTRVRAVGTVFNVERSDQGVSVTVVEGQVTVTQQPADTRGSGAHDASAATDVSLGVDEQLVISSAGEATAIRKVKGEMEVAWAAGQLIFDNESVADIARRFNLYNRIQIQVLDRDLAARRVSGMFRATDPDSFVAFVQSAGDVSVARPDANVIQLGVPSLGANSAGHQ